MASNNPKKTKTAKKSGKKSTAKTQSAQPRPVRREVGGVVLWLLALCVFVSYLDIHAIFIDWLAIFVKGLFGYGYWLAAPAMILAGWVLLFHHGRPVQLRVTSALLLPVAAGSLFHMLLCKETYTSSIAILKALWLSGRDLRSGGAVAGALAEGFVAVFSKFASVIIFIALILVLVMVAFHLTLSALLEKHRSRPRYVPEPEPEKPVQTVIPETPKRRVEEKPRQRIDFPLDEDPFGIEEKKEAPSRFTGFFRHKADHQKTPDQVLTEKQPEPLQAEVKPTPAEPAAAPVPIQPEPTAEPELPVSAKKKKLAQEVAAQTAAVTAEIEQRKAAEEETYCFPPITLLHENR